jgi:hypothetical protein
LLPIIRSAAPRSRASAAALSAPKKPTQVGTPFSSAIRATLAAGSTPRAGIPRATKYWSRYPSLEAISTTREDGPSAKRAEIIST